MKARVIVLFLMSVHFEATAANSTVFILDISSKHRGFGLSGNHINEFLCEQNNVDAGIDVAVQSQLNDSRFADPPFDISVDLNVQKRGELRQIIPTILWKATNDSRRKRYELVVDAISSGCRRYFHRYDASVSPTQTFYTVSSTTYREIKRGCAYNVSLSSVPPFPTDNNNFTVFTIFKADDCIDGNCRCFKPFPAPSNIILTTNEVSDELTSMALVSWTYPSDRKDIDHFLITLWEKILSSANSSMHKKQLIKNVTYSSMYSSYSTKFTVGKNRNYNIEVAAVDEHQCQVSVNRSLSVYDTALSTVGAYIIPAIILTFCIIMAFAIGIFMWNRRQKSHCRQSTVLYKPSANYYSVNSKSDLISRDTSVFSERQDLNIISQHFNINYVEKEIQEARDMGLVDLYEIHEGRLTMGQEIGKGAFGRVCVARAESIAGIPGQIVVAVKCLRENSNEQEKTDFLAEISMMKKAGRHTNIITMLGCCTLQEPFCMIMEYIAYGDLLNYLWKLRAEYERKYGLLLGLTSSVLISTDKKSSKLLQDESQTSNETVDAPCKKSVKSYHTVEDCSAEFHGQKLSFKGGPRNLSGGYKTISIFSKTTDDTSLCDSGDIINGELSSDNHLEIALDMKELQNFAYQIASGMSHLANKKIVHRDLAARNILIDGNKVLKISDFGLSRTGVYVTHRGGRVPLRWLSIEAIRDHLYSTESDVWAFATVLWEICTLGGFPYSSISDTELFGHLIRGNRLERPINCSENLYTLMNSCWRHNPQQRPTFDELCETLELMGQEPHTYVNFDTSGTMVTLPPKQGKGNVC